MAGERTKLRRETVDGNSALRRRIPGGLSFTWARDLTPSPERSSQFLWFATFLSGFRQTSNTNPDCARAGGKLSGKPDAAGNVPQSFTRPGMAQRRTFPAGCAALAKRFRSSQSGSTHLGCPVRWFEESHLFMCPCHGGAHFLEDGSHLPARLAARAVSVQIQLRTANSGCAADTPTLSEPL